MNDWWKKAVVYQVYPKSFNDSNGDGLGDLNGITEKLPYIKKLGADVIWLNPIYQSPYVDNGYDISDYEKIEPTLGTMADFDRLLKGAHDLDLKIIMDLVVNHTSDEHEWFQQAKSSRANRYHDYYIWKDPVDGHEPTNWGSSFGGSTWEYVDACGQYYLHLFAKEQPDLNWENPVVRNAVYNIMRFWLDKGIDGFRMDVINLISKRPDYPDGPVVQNKQYGSYYAGAANGPRVHEFLQEMNREVLSHYDIMTVGEAPHTSADEAVRYMDARRHELNMVFHFDHMHLDYDQYGKFSDKRFALSDLKDVMTHWQAIAAANDGWNSLYWSNHDQARAVSRFGNDRIYRVESAKMLGTLLHMMQGTPYIYEGEELGMTNVSYPSIDDYDDLETHNIYNEFKNVHHFEEAYIMKTIHLKSRDNARTPMQWDASSQAGFTTGTPWLKVNPNYKQINAQAALDDPDSVFYYYRKLTDLRHSYAIVTSGRYALIDAANPEIYAFTRTAGNEQLLVICSFADHALSYELPAELLRGAPRRLLLASDKAAEASDSAVLQLAPYGARVYLLTAEK
ncbi:MAG: alpha-glucosidase [Sporolactobacillus sp.]